MKNKWDNKIANSFIKKYKSQGINRNLALRIYSTRLLGNEPELVLHGGGNTSLKDVSNNSLGKKINIIYVKGSGKDMSIIDKEGFPALELDNLVKLNKIKKMNDFQMINFQKKYMIDTTFPNASIETLLHAFLPHKYIDHTHSNAILSLIDQPNDIKICKRIFKDELGIVPYIMPGFDLSKKAYEIFKKNPKVKGLILLKHGIFTFGDTAKQSYDRMIKYVSLAEKELRKNINNYKIIKYKNNNINISNLSNLFRKYLSEITNDDYKRKIISYSNITTFDQFFNKKFNSQIKGPVTPDHVIRIKHKPLFLDFSNIKIINLEKEISKKIAKYKKNYIKYFNANKFLNKNAKMHDPNPRLIIVKGIGLFSVGDNYKESKIAMDVGISSLSVILNANKYGKFISISEKEIFRMEYWPLELAKLKQSNLPLKGQVTLITGGLGTIGYATALKFLKEGSEVVLIDNKLYNKDISNMTFYKCDVTDEKQITKILNLVSKKFGGIDIIISNAGLAIQKSLKDINKAVLDKSFSINFFAHHYLTQKSVEILKRQSTGGSILFNISKQSVNPGKDFGSYGLPKSTLLFLMKQYALEFGQYGIRFNGINADRIKSGLLNEKLITKRAKKRGLSIKSYMTGNLLKKEVKPNDVANAFFYLSCSLKTTACILTVDGGNIEASLR